MTLMSLSSCGFAMTVRSSSAYQTQGTPRFLHGDDDLFLDSAHYLKTSSLVFNDTHPKTSRLNSYKYYMAQVTGIFTERGMAWYSEGTSKNVD
jgi:hypothetical protein